MRTQLLAAAAVAALLGGGALAQQTGDQQNGHAPQSTDQMKHHSATPSQPAAEDQDQTSGGAGAQMNGPASGPPRHHVNTGYSGAGPDEQNNNLRTNTQFNDQSQNNATNGNINERTNERTNVRTNINNSRTVNRTNVRLNVTQKTRLRQDIIATGRAPRVDHVDFRINVGVPVPRHVRVVPVPEEIVEINPAWAGFEYFVYGDEIVIVDPASFEIAGVLAI